MLKTVADGYQCQEDVHSVYGGGVKRVVGLRDGLYVSKVQDPRSPTEPKSQGLVTRRQAGKENPSLVSASRHESDGQVVPCMNGAAVITCCLVVGLRFCVASTLRQDICRDAAGQPSCRHRMQINLAKNAQRVVGVSQAKLGDTREYNSRLTRGIVCNDTTCCSPSQQKTWTCQLRRTICIDTSLYQRECSRSHDLTCLTECPFFLPRKATMTLRSSVCSHIPCTGMTVGTHAQGLASAARHGMRLSRRGAMLRHSSRPLNTSQRNPNSSIVNHSYS